MLSFVKGIFYLTMSIVLVATYNFTTNYLEKLDNRVTEKKNFIDDYYKKEFDLAWSMNFSGFKGVVSRGEDLLEDAFKNALYDGCSKAEIESMSSKGYGSALKLEGDRKRDLKDKEEDIFKASRPI